MHLSGGGGDGPLRSESACLPGVTLALAAPGPPVQLRWTTLRVQGPTLRDAALANDGNGSPPVAPRLHPPPPRWRGLVRHDPAVHFSRHVGSRIPPQRPPGHRFRAPAENFSNCHNCCRNLYWKWPNDSSPSLHLVSRGLESPIS